MADNSKNTGMVTAVCIGGLLVVILAIGLAKGFGYFEGQLPKRIVGMLFGVILIMVGNFLPKIIDPLKIDDGQTVAAHGIERFAGWIFVLAGVLYLSVWLFSTTQSAMLISSAVGLVAFAIVGAVFMRIAFQAAPHTRSELNEGGTSLTTLFGKRMAMFLILHALLWVFAMFFTDAIWGDKTAPWMVVGFMTANGLLALGFLRTRRN